MARRAGLATVCICLALTASASAAPTWLPPTDIAGPTTAITFPELAVNAHGDAVAIWPRNTGSETVLETLERPAGGDWSQPVTLSEPGEALFPLQTPVDIGLDDAGNAVAVWSVNLGSAIRTAVRPVGGDWSDPEDLSVYNGQAPNLAMNAAGDAVAVWTGFDGVDDEVTWAATRPAGGDWSTPEKLSVADENDGFNPRVAIDAAGNAIAVWQRFDLPHDAVQAAVRTADSSNWSAPHTISGASEDARSPRIAMNAAGAAVAAWSPLGGGIRTATRPFAGGWSAPEDLSTAGEYPALAIDPSGNAFALWPGAGDDENVLWAAMRPKGDSWSAPEKLSDEAQMFQSYYLDSSPAAGIVAIWTRSPSTTSHEVQAAVRPPGGSWSQPEEISTAGENSGLAYLGFDAEGNAITIWGREGAANEFFLQGSGYDFTGPQLNGLQIPATGAVGEPVNFAVSPFDVFSLGVTSWAFGDGQFAAGDTVTHVYATPGEFPVTVNAADGSGNVSAQTATISITDVVPPAPPQLLGTDPASPNVSGTPRIHGNAEAGSTVRLYAGTTCAGQPVATVSAAELASPGISVAVAEGATAAFSATASDTSANTSACSAAISYMRLRPTGPPPSPRCIVPKLSGKKLMPAKRKIRAAGCAVGKVTKPKARKGKKRGPLVVKSSRPSAGKSLPVGSQVDLRLGPKPRKTPR